MKMSDLDILVNFNKNIIFEASAGTGKTATLTSKILIYILGESQSGDRKTSSNSESVKSFGNFAALTFTEKAAIELKERIKILLSSLDDGKNNNVNGIKNSASNIKEVLALHYNLSEDEIRERAKNISQISDRFTITTIHGFCLAILESFGTFINLSPKFNIDASLSKSTKIFNDLWLDFISKKLGKNNSESENWHNIFDTTCDLSTLRDLSFELATSTIEINKLNRVKYESCDEMVSIVEEKNDGRKIINNNLFYFSFLTEINPFIERVRDEWVKKSTISFNQLLLLTLKLLKENPAARDMINTRYRVFFVDESQDTDPIQYEIIQNILEQDGKIRDGSLFIVGDPKQSIYRFRGADLRAYDIIKKRLTDNGALLYSLSKNYRSNSKIISHVNALFSKIEIFDESSECKYSHLESNKNSSLLIDSPLEIWVSANKSDGQIRRINSETASEIEAQHIARWIHENVNNPFFKDNKILKYKDIAILFRALTNSKIYTDELERYGIPYVSIGGKGFFEREEIITILNLLRTIINPEDSISLVGFLKSPVVSSPDKGIIRLKELGILDSHKVPEEFPKPCEGWELNTFKILSIISKYRENFLTYPIDKWCFDLVNEVPITPIFGSMENGVQKISNIKKILDDFICQNKSNEENISNWLSEKSSFVEEHPFDEEQLWDENVDIVRIMSIHKAKGLEFPVVFFPDNHRQLRKSDLKNFAIISQGDEISILIKDREKNKIVTSKYPAMEKYEAENNLCEAKRLSYVAQTRAKEKLIILGGFTEAKSRFDSSHIKEILTIKDAIDEISINKKKSINIKEGNGVRLISGFSDIAKKRSEADNISDGSPFNKEEYVALWIKEQKSYNEIMDRRVFISPSHLIHEDMASDWLINKNSKSTQKIGTLCHRILSRINFNNFDNEFTHLLDSESKLIEMDYADLKRSGEILLNFSRSEIFLEILNSEIIGREIPFIMSALAIPSAHEFNLTTDAVIPGYIDIVYKINDRFIVADYKTGFADQSKINIYKPQILLYKEALRSALNLPYSPTFKLIFLNDGKVFDD